MVHFCDSTRGFAQKLNNLKSDLEEYFEINVRDSVGRKSN
jgi:hypothetical protein